MAKISLGIIAIISLLFLIAIVAMLLDNAMPFFKNYSLSEFFLNGKWHPASEPPIFGILALLWGSFIVTFIAMFVALPVGIASALYLNGIAPVKLREVLKPIIEILGSVPSVIYGLFGLVILAPFAQRFLHLPVGQCAAVAGVVLGIMVIPTIVSVFEDSLSAVPKSLWEAGYSLGSTKWETLVKIVLPAAKSGLMVAVLLAFGRAIGETMTVLMVAGGAAQIKLSPFVPVRPMTATIAAEMGETPQGSMHFHSLFAVGTILLIITFVTNLIASRYAERRS